MFFPHAFLLERAVAQPSDVDRRFDDTLNVCSGMENHRKPGSHLFEVGLGMCQGSRSPDDAPLTE